MNFNSFDESLFNQLCNNSDKNTNVFFSPLNIKLTLSMLLLGSKGKTKKQLEEALGFLKNDELIGKLKDSNDLLNTNKKGLSVKLASGVFPSEQFQMLKTYSRDLLKAFNCQIQCLKYMGNPEISKKIINDWVETTTKGKIKDLFTEISADTACVLVSCGYFKGDWLHKFKSQNSFDGFFFCANKKASTVKVMSQKNYYLYTSDNQNRFQCVKIPYRQKDFNMLIVLPYDRFGVDNVVQCLDVETNRTLDNKNFTQKYILLKMPKFKIEYSTKLNNVLKMIGIRDAFNKENADFSAMSVDALQSNGRLFVSEVVHKAFIETGDEGTEAAAENGITMSYKCLKSRPEEPYPFIVEHPFVFMIQHKSQTLFIGKVNSLC